MCPWGHKELHETEIEKQQKQNKHTGEISNKYEAKINNDPGLLQYQKISNWRLPPS